MKRLILTLSALITATIIIAPFGQIYAASTFFDNSKSEACQGANIGSSSSSCDSSAGTSLNNIIKNAINLLSIIIGIIAVVMIIVGGVKFITSGGEASNVSSAKNTILYAVVGLIIVAFAQVIVHFVLSKVGPTT
jgi:uncharacterized membrane protein